MSTQKQMSLQKTDYWWRESHVMKMHRDYVIHWEILLKKKNKKKKKMQKESTNSIQIH